MLKLVTVLFADVVSSTARAEQMYPEDVRALMSDFFDAMVAEIRAEGGRIEKFIGDAVMAVFGVPRAHEDDPVRAVRAARRMLHRLNEWNEGREALHQINIRIGVNTGDVLAAAPGSDMMVTGDAVNVAARLEQAAAAGTIVVGRRTARAAERYFTVQELEALQLKGKSRPVSAFLVVDEREIVEPRASATFTAPLIGRDQELAHLHSVLERTAARRVPELVTVVADAGVGKSRLIRDFTASVQTETRVLSGRCLPYGEGITLWPLGEILRAETGILLTDPADVALEKLDKLVRYTIRSELAPDPDRAVAAFAATIALSRGDELLEDLDPRERFRAILETWRALFTALAGSSPLLVVIDDIHWADPTMLEALQSFVNELTVPIVFLCPARADLYTSRPDWGEGHERFTTLNLEPLDQEHSKDLIASLLQESEIPAELQATILGRSEGNPFFLEEILHRLVDAGMLTRVGERWRAAPDIAQVDIPDNVQAVILARIDLLPAAEKRFIQNAAVVGRAFWPGALRHLGDIGDLGEMLEHLEHRQLVFKLPSSSMAGENEYIFKHILIRDVAYESLPRNRRAAAHVGVAGWIKDVSGERADELAELVAHHYHQAFGYSKQDDYRKEARTLYCTAAMNACQRFAIQQSETYGWLSVDLSLPGAERVETLESLGDVYCMSFGMDGAWKVYRDALKEITESNVEDREAVGRLSAKAAIVPTRYEATMRTRPSADSLNDVISVGLEAVGDIEGRDMARLLASKAIMQAFGYEEMDERGEEAAVAAVEIAERIEDPDLLSCALDATTYWLAAEGLYGQIRAINERRLQLVPHLIELREICDVYIVGTWSALYVGRYRDAVVNATANITRAQALEPGSYLVGLVDRVHARFMTGDWDGALADQAEVEHLQVEEGRELPSRSVSFGYAVAMYLRQLRGEHDLVTDYEKLLRRFDDEYKVIGRATTVAAFWARSLAHRGEANAARDILYLERDPALCGHLEVLCDVVAAQEDWDAAPEAIAMSRSEAERAELLALPCYADRLEGRFFAAHEEWVPAVTLLQRSRDGFAELAAPWEAAFSALLLAEVMLANGRPEMAGAELARSHEVFERLGSDIERERARRLLQDL